MGPTPNPFPFAQESNLPSRGICLKAWEKERGHFFHGGGDTHGHLAPSIYILHNGACMGLRHQWPWPSAASQRVNFILCRWVKSFKFQIEQNQEVSLTNYVLPAPSSCRLGCSCSRGTAAARRSWITKKVKISWKKSCDLLDKQSNAATSKYFNSSESPNIWYLDSIRTRGAPSWPPTRRAAAPASPTAPTASRTPGSSRPANGFKGVGLHTYDIHSGWGRGYLLSMEVEQGRLHDVATFFGINQYWSKVA